MLKDLSESAQSSLSILYHMDLHWTIPSKRTVRQLVCGCVFSSDTYRKTNSQTHTPTTTLSDQTHTHTNKDSN